MSPEAWFTVATILMVVAALATNRIGVDVAMLGGLTLLLLADVLVGGILPLNEGIAGFAHPAVLMIGSLFVVAGGLKETGGMEWLAQKMLGRPKTTAGAQLRMMVPVALMSGVMNNTPIVAMYLPIISDWSRKLRISPSKLYMPLSFAAILGGKITLIGTASNIVVMELFIDFIGARLGEESSGAAVAWLEPLGVVTLSPRAQFWGIAVVGIPAAIIGIVAIVFFARWLLPERRPATKDVLDSRRYQVEMVVRNDSPVAGRSIEEAGLRHLPGLYLTQIERGEQVMSAVGPDEVLHGGDILSFTGILESVVDLQRIRGLDPATDEVKKVSARRVSRTLVEAVIARTSPLVGSTVRESQFRTRFNAAIIAVHRNGEVVQRKVGDITLQPGDTLLLDTHGEFVAVHRNSDQFHLVSRVDGSRPVGHDRAWIALMILAALVIMLTMKMPPVVAALVAAGAMVVSRCVTGTIARGSINWQILIVIGSALGMGRAMEHTGAAATLATGLTDLANGASPFLMLLMIFFIAVVVATLVTPNGAAVLMFPIAMTAAESLGVDPTPFAITLMVAAGTTLLTPVSYQTNLMVYGAGGYRFLDYARLGLPITILTGFVTAGAAPLFFPFGG